MFHCFVFGNIKGWFQFIKCCYISFFPLNFRYQYQLTCQNSGLGLGSIVVLCCADVCSNPSSAELFPDKLHQLIQQPGLEILQIGQKYPYHPAVFLTHPQTHLLFCPPCPFRSSITFAPKTRSPCVHITPQNVDHSREAGKSTHTLFGLRFPPPPLALPVTRLAERCRHIPGTSDCAQQRAGLGGHSPARWPHLLWREVSGRGGVFGTVARMSYCTRISSFRAHSQIGGRGVTAPPSFCQAVFKQQGRRWTSTQKKRNVSGASANNKTLNLWTYGSLYIKDHIHYILYKIGA